MAWVNTKINSTSASAHNSNIVNIYGGGLFSKEAFTNISIMALIVRRLTEMRNVNYDENDE